jgi:hypothetical protein
MKTLNFLNLALVVTVVITGILSPFIKDCGLIAFFTGLFVMPAYQLLSGLIWLTNETNNKDVTNYFKGVLGYFFLMFAISLLHNSLINQSVIESIMMCIGVSIPILLALYFTFILNKNARR